MRILPAIDLKDGKCVRLQKGDYATAHQVAEDAVETARHFLFCGASLIHMVDLDAAKDGVHQNYDVVRHVLLKTGAQVELGGGIRTLEDVKTALSLGVVRVVIGSAAVEDPDMVRQAVSRYGGNIAVGIDARDGTVRTNGWLEDSGVNYIDFAKQMEKCGVQTIIFTDIDRDGMLEGPNLQTLEQLRKSVSCRIVASGGVSSIEDIRALKKLGVDEAIAGKAVYTGSLDLKQAIQEG